MIVLWLLIAHLVGDYLFQTRWQAAGKFGWTREAVLLRFDHCLGYVLAFIPLPYFYGVPGAAFLLLLFVAHFFTDAQRFTSTPGEWIVWNWRFRPNPRALVATTDEEAIAAFQAPFHAPLEPNPWPPIGLAIDQTLHLIQIAVLAEVFLR